MNLVPTSGKAEFSLTFQCDLTCRGCTRASFLREAHTPSMQREDAEEFFRQADELGWKPRIILTGGEPTMHPDFEWFVHRCGEWSGTYVQVFSNAYSEKSKKRLEMVRGPASICPDTHKPGGSVNGPEDYAGWVDDAFISPDDLGKALRAPCYQHASLVCGISVDRSGYSPCAPGGAIAALLGVGRTKVLSDLFDPLKVAEMTAALCAHCGVQGVGQGIFSEEEKASFPLVFGVHMSPTWQAAFAERR